MSKKYMKLDRPIKEYASDELKGKIGHLKKSELMRTIILNERDFLRVNYDRSLRGFWYSTVKPTLDKLGLLTEKDATEESLTRWDAELSRYVAELVRLGEVTYQKLRIVDTSRQRSTPVDTYDSGHLETYGYQVAGSAYPNIIISTEKDTVFNIISDMATFFGCSCISGKGQNSLAAMEDLLRRMDETSSSPYDPICILTMTDYDPAGYYIADTFRQQAEDLKGNLGIKRTVRIERIGIFPNQLTPEELAQNWYTPKPDNLDKWLEATGGINGQPKGLELDALEPDRIRRIFVDALRRYVNPAYYAAFIRKSYLQKMVLEAMRDKVAEIVETITRDELESVEMMDVDLMDMAAGGARYIPIEELCFTRKENQIRDKALSYFGGET